MTEPYRAVIDVSGFRVKVDLRVLGGLKAPIQLSMTDTLVRMAPAEARDLASALIERADAVEQQPDPQDPVP